MNTNKTEKSDFRIPVLFLIFNRLTTVKQVFKEIRDVKPKSLYIASDGPREGVQGEAEVVKEARDYVINNTDWDCEIKTLFREENLGCKEAVSSAITWFFQNEEMGIILEDDCLPSQSFFYYCEDLLNRYKEDERIMLISGFNKQNTWNPEKYDYFFSHFGGIWGWASWRRAWEHYDGEMEFFQTFIEQDYFEYLLGKRIGKSWKILMEDSPNSSWAYPWAFARHVNSGLACVPSKNLIRNIGFGEDATHTKRKSKIGQVDLQEYDFPLSKNPVMVADRKYDSLFHPRTNFFKRRLKKYRKIVLEKLETLR
jgi:hypothetical protein